MADRGVLTFFAPGVPASQGSKRGFARGKRVVLVEHDKGLKSWRSLVATTAQVAGAVIIDGPVGLHATFRYTRPRSHYGSGRNAQRLKDNAPPYPATKTSKDADKLARGICDALTAICFHDDAQIAHLVVKKRWSLPGRPGGVLISVYPLPSGLSLREDVEPVTSDKAP